MTKTRKVNDPAIVLGSALVHLQRASECDLLAEAQDYVCEIDRDAMHRAAMRAKAQNKAPLSAALLDVIRLLNAVFYLDGDGQFAEWKVSVAPVLEHLKGEQ